MEENNNIQDGLENEVSDNTNIEKNKNTNSSKKTTTGLYIVLFILSAIIGFIVMIILYNSAADVAKPIIYLYPETQIQLNVTLAYPEKLTCSYPKYNANTGWNIIAHPNGTLIETDTNKKLYSLYWEGKDYNSKMQDEGFIIKGENVAEFLEEKLAILGLNYKEAQEFIIYWLPKLESNKYNYIRFATIDEINEYMPLNLSIKPDSLIRVFMEFKALNHYINIPEQKLETPDRNGFVVIEWGGSEIK